MLAVFILSVAALPVMAPLPLWDDWIYSSSVDALVRHGQLWVHPLSAAAILFQIGWGSTFGYLFGLSFGTLRLSTVVLAAASCIPMYALLRELGVRRGSAALGTAVYAFNPIAYVLTLTFMTDVPFTALLVLASYCYVRGVRDGALATWPTVLGSAVAAVAATQRQMGFLVPAAVLLSWLLIRRPKGPALVRDSLKIIAIPLAMAALYVLVLHPGKPSGTERAFVGAVGSTGPLDAVTLSSRVLFTELLYVGLFVLPFTATRIRPVLRQLRAGGRPARVAVAVCAALICVGAVANRTRGISMPVAASWFTRHGLGPDDLIASGRPVLLGTAAGLVLSAVCAGSVCLLAASVVARLSGPEDAARRRALVVLAVLLSQAIGVLAPSFFFDGALDRYLLPLLPLSIALAAWALPQAETTVQRSAAWLVTACFGLFAVLGTADFLSFERTAWSLASEATHSGAGMTQVDAGAAWAGYHAWPLSHGAPARPGAPWYINSWGRAIDSTYVVSGRPLPGYTVVLSRPYHSWLAGRSRLLLLQRTATAGR